MNKTARLISKFIGIALGVILVLAILWPVNWCLNYFLAGIGVNFHMDYSVFICGWISIGAIAGLLKSKGAFGLFNCRID